MENFDLFSAAIGFGVAVIIMLIYCNAQLHLVGDRYEEIIEKQRETIKKAFKSYMRD